MGVGVGDGVEVDVGVKVGQGVGVSVGVRVGLGVCVGHGVGLMVGVHVGGDVVVGVGVGARVNGVGAGGTWVKERITTNATIPKTTTFASTRAATTSHLFRVTDIPPILP